MKLFFLFAFLFCIKILNTYAHYDTAYIQDICNLDGSGVWNLGSNNANSSGILKTTRNGRFLKGKNCTIQIQPPLGYGIILSVRRVDFRPFYKPDCKSYIEISDELKPVKLCGYSDDLSEFQSYYSEGKAMQLNFVTVNESGSVYQSEVFFVVTAFLKFSYSCELKMFRCENSRCIWKGLTCDGHNNCGDQSDEFSRQRANCGALPPGIIVGIVVGSVISFIIFILTVFACYRWISRNQNTESDPPLIQPDPIYNPRPDSIYSSRPDSIYSSRPDLIYSSRPDQFYTPRVRSESIQQSEDLQQPHSSHFSNQPEYRNLPPPYKP